MTNEARLRVQHFLNSWKRCGIEGDAIIGVMTGDDTSIDLMAEDLSALLADSGKGESVGEISKRGEYWFHQWRHEAMEALPDGKHQLYAAPQASEALSAEQCGKCVDAGIGLCKEGTCCATLNDPASLSAESALNGDCDEAYFKRWENELEPLDGAAWDRASPAENRGEQAKCTSTTQDTFLWTDLGAKLDKVMEQAECAPRAADKDRARQFVTEVALEMGFAMSDFVQEIMLNQFLRHAAPRTDVEKDAALERQILGAISQAKTTSHACDAVRAILAAKKEKP